MTTLLNSLPRTDLKAKLDVAWVRSQFPSLSRTINGQTAAFLDGPGGTQVTQSVIDAIWYYLKTSNANTHGQYVTSRETDEIIASARSAMADFLGCVADEVVFGPNMTSLTFAISRSIGRELGPGDEILLTHLDHSANVSPWQALEERGVKIQFVDIRKGDCTLDMDDLARKLSSRTKVVAVGYASNAVGTINDVKTIIRIAHDAGAVAYVDAVHYAPHGVIDVRALDCDFLACSTYKFFGPHMGVLYGKREHLERLHPYKVRPNTNEVPGRWEMGTLNHECIAGITACVGYLAEIGSKAVSPTTNDLRPDCVVNSSAPPTVLSNPTNASSHCACCADWQKFLACAYTESAMPSALRNAVPRLRSASKAAIPQNCRNNSASVASSPGTATTTPSTSPSVSASKRTAAFSALASSTTTRKKRSIAC